MRLFYESKVIVMKQSTLLFASFMAPTLYKTYRSITEYIEQYVGVPTFLINGCSLEDFADGSIDAGFICGLSYVQLAAQQPQIVEPLVAPIFSSERYQQRPRYFTDMVVRADGPVYKFTDVRDGVWAYNKKSSHAGHNVVCYTLQQMGWTTSYFRETVETGSHVQSLRMVLNGEVDVAAIDSYVLDILLLKQPELAMQLRVIASLGPSTIPPIVVSSALHPVLKRKIYAALLSIHQHPVYSEDLRASLIERFVPVTDDHYRDIRMMYQQFSEGNTLLEQPRLLRQEEIYSLRPDSIAACNNTRVRSLTGSWV